jgi:hypothetical protein
MKVGFLRDLLRSDSIYIANNITVHNLEPIASFLGKLGAEAQNGLPLDEFLRRQHLHREAENNAMIDVASFMAKAREIYGYQHFLNDTGGSVCELNSPAAEKVLAENTLLLYIRADDDMEQELVQRAKREPKPLYYNETFLRQQLDLFLQLENLSSADDINPEQFATWIFPALVKHRRPLYQALADKYGYTVTAQEAEQIDSEADFLELIEQVIGRSDSK